MTLIAEIVSEQERLKRWRRDLHANPELAFEETGTADFVAAQLESFGVEVSRGIGGTGMVGTLTIGKANKAISLRADMDALPMDEDNTFAHKSKIPGRMHGCGHDGHMVMLLAAAKYLSATRDFKGTVHFIFQPAEEANSQGSGAKAMIDDGLFDRFPSDCVFALHNAPGLRAGAVATAPGVLLASMDIFEVVITGKGTHGAFPESGIDPIVVASQMITAWQTILSRNISSSEQAVISVGSINAGAGFNVIPSTATIRGTIRTLGRETQNKVANQFHLLAKNIANAFGATVTVNYKREYPVTVNDDECTAFACDVASSIVGEEQVIRDADPVMGSDDFAAMLEIKAGCYLWLGNTDPDIHLKVKSPNSKNKGLLISDPCMVHEPTYDFNDKIIPIGASLFVGLVEKYLS